MDINLKFRVGQTVYFKHKQNIVKGVINSFIVQYKNNILDIKYGIENFPYYLDEIQLSHE